MCDGWVIVTNSSGFPIYKARYKTKKELRDCEHTVSTLLEFPGFRWARGVTEEDVRSQIADQITRAKECGNACADNQER